MTDSEHGATTPLCLMAVHAHPDDEASTTGGILARYASEGVQTVLVVCTNGELGDGPGGTKPGTDGHDEEAVLRTRRAELARSCAILGVQHLELLGYHDSGMMGWPQNEAPNAFWNVPVERAARALDALINRYRPQVVVTYDDNGLYGHPDHVQAHRITLAALEQTGVADKLYCSAIPKSGVARMTELLAQVGFEPPVADDAELDFGVADHLITTRIDCSPFAQAKFEALRAHASQSDSAFLTQFGTEAFAQLFGVEHFIRLFDRGGATLPEDDLFAGLR